MNTFIKLFGLCLLTIACHPLTGQTTFHNAFDYPGMPINHVLADGSIITAGCSHYSEIRIMKYDAGGAVLWAYRYDPSPLFQMPNSANFLTTDPDGNIIFGGDLKYVWPHRSYIVKLDSMGNVIFYKSYTGVGQIPPSVSFNRIAIRNNLYYIAGYTDSATVFCVRGSNGNMLWTKKFQSDFYELNITDILFRNDDMLLAGLTTNYNTTSFQPGFAFPVILITDTLGAFSNAYVYADTVNNYLENIMSHETYIRNNDSNHLLMYVSPVNGLSGPSSTAPLAMLTPSYSLLWGAGIPGIMNAGNISGYPENTNEVMMSYKRIIFGPEDLLCKFSNTGQLVYNVRCADDFGAVKSFLNRADSTSYIYTFHEQTNPGSTYIIKELTQPSSCDSLIPMSPAVYAPSVISVLTPFSMTASSVTVATPTLTRTNIPVNLYPFCQVTGWSAPSGPELQVFPNPSSGKIHVNSVSGIEAVSLINMAGEQLNIRLSKNNSGFTVHTLNATPGLYVLKIVTSGSTLIEKIVISETED